MEQILVKIVKGVYGFDTGKTVVGKSPKDAPFLLDEDKARRLIGLGVAEPVCDDTYLDSHVYAVEEDAETDEGVDEIHTEDMEELNLAEMTLEELKEFAEPYGLKYKVGTKKADFIQQIREALEEKAHEEPPSFDASEAVQ